ncbi:hypothetical protein Efla_002494 [Eimeria flavescens]
MTATSPEFPSASLLPLCDTQRGVCECYNDFNAVRTLNLEHPLGTLTPDTELGEQARAKVKELARAGCEKGMTATGKEIGGLLLKFGQGLPNCADLLQAALNECLTEWGSTPPPAYGDGQFWDSASAQACSVMLWSSSSKIGCGFSHGCPQTNVLVCQTSPSPIEGQNAFSAAQYASLLSRQQKGPEVRTPASNNAGRPAGLAALASLSCIAAVLLAFV